jgi:hypothetical protein
MRSHKNLSMVNNPVNNRYSDIIVIKEIIPMCKIFISGFVAKIFLMLSYPNFWDGQLPMLSLNGAILSRILF